MRVNLTKKIDKNGNTKQRPGEEYGQEHTLEIITNSSDRFYESSLEFCD